MIDGVAIPSLGPDGWIKEPGKALDRLLAYAFESDKSQTYSYGKNVTSLAHIYATNNHEPQDMAREFQSALQTMLERHFPVVSVICTAVQEEDNENNYSLRLSIQVEDNQGNKLDLDKVVKGNNAKITDIINYLNG